jgi:ABC-type branched-subunit amino acid transport system ATPase component
MSYFRAENLSLHFGGLKAVDSVSFAVEKGEILSIIGPNGAGKSSIFNLISRIYPPTSGRIFSKTRTSPSNRLTRLQASASPAPSRTSNCSRMRPC